MKKTLLIAAAALAAGLISIQAQVYSQNIVGYVNVNLAPGFNVVANPLDNAGGNSLTNLIPALLSGSLDGSYIYVWNTSHYDTYYVDSTLGGVADFGDNVAVVPPVLNPGQSVFITSVTSTNITYVGTVHTDGSGVTTYVVGVTTNSLSGLQFIASRLPVAGGINTGLGLPTAGGSMDGGYIYIPNIVSGGLHGFNSYYIDSTLGGTGIADFGDNVLVPEPVIPVGGGFFLQSVAPIQWIQSY